MSYRVLARTYRSSTFDEVVGEEAVATTLKNAIASGRIHHGYLFTGTRGVGKTSMARILAKALNCLESDAPTTTPCCKCESCLPIAEGEDVDVVEIDAASNTGVDNIRELRSNAAFRPARSRFKVYIIDEVHMLSTGAFNALLKTLEEPPEHVKFILATTNPEKIPATIQSRCQRFDFRAIDAEAITDHLKKIVEAEKVNAEDAVLRRVGRLAKGSMRDALSLLDKLLSYESKELTTTIADQIIPPPHDELASAVMVAIAENDAAGAMMALDTALQTGRTIDRFCDHLIDHLRTLMLMHVCGEHTDLVDVPEQVRAALAEQSGKFDAPTYVYMISLLEQLRRAVRSSGAGRALADAAIVRLALSRQFSDITELLRRLDSGDESPIGSAKALGATASKKKEELGSGLGTPTISTANVARDVGAFGQNRGSSAGETKAESDGTGHSPQTESGARATQGSTTSVRPPASISSSEWQEVATDPLVVKIREAVDGTLFDVRPARGKSSDVKDENVDGNTNDAEPVS